MHPNDAGTGGAIAMDLDDLHTLTLRGRTNANRVQLDPELGRITINGAPVLTSANAASALGATFITPAQLEGRSYLSSAGGRVGLGAGATLRPLQPAQNQVGQAVLGRYNDPARTEGVLIVGTGQRHADGTITRQNGLRILDDGTVLIQPKGGLQMTLGVFDKGPQP